MIIECLLYLLMKLKRKKTREIQEKDRILFFYIIIMSSDEEDHQFDSVLGEDDYGDFDDSFESSEEDQDEMIDYEGMKSALELIRQVRT